jgi:hypothetical protein
MDEEASHLLFEWYCWWFASSDAPAKMPEALHIRTALALLEQGFDVAPTGSMEAGLQQ